MATERVTVYIPKQLRRELAALVEARDGGTLSGYILFLIRATLQAERNKHPAGAAIPVVYQQSQPIPWKK